MRGVIVITAESGRALRGQRVAPRVCDVLDRSGDFRVGDRVYIVVRGRDGGQAVVASAAARCDATALPATGVGIGVIDAAMNVVHEQGLELLWAAQP